MTQLCGHLLTLLGSECHHKIILLQTKSDLSYNMFVNINTPSIYLTDPRKEKSSKRQKQCLPFESGDIISIKMYRYIILEIIFLTACKVTWIKTIINKSSYAPAYTVGIRARRRTVKQPY